MKIKATVDTLLKLKPSDSSELNSDQYTELGKDSEIEILDYEELKSHLSRYYHIRLTVDPKVSKLNSDILYVFSEHIEMIGTEDDNLPSEAVEGETISNPESDKKVLKGPFQLPGYESTFYMNAPIIKDGRMFWYEALHSSPSSSSQYRKPSSKNIVDNILKIANVIEDLVRPTFKSNFGQDKILVNSWYRDPITNRRVGGASRSRHVQGDAIDLRVPGVSTRDLYKSLDKKWDGGLAYHPSFLHIDDRGYKARWNY